MSEKSARERADELLTHLNNDKAINDLFGDAFERQYLIYGKPPREWRRHFKIIIPESPDVAQCKAIAARLANLTQEANFFYAAAEAQVDALASGQAKEYTSAFNRLVAEHNARNQKLPAQKTLETIAENTLMDINGAIQNAKIIKNFWKRMLEGLTEVRKDLELASWNNHNQIKQETYGGGGSVPTREEFGNKQKDEWDEVDPKDKEIGNEW